MILKRQLADVFLQHSMVKNKSIFVTLNLLKHMGPYGADLFIYNFCWI